MANNIKTVMTYPLDGSTVNFTIPFEYLARKFVTVTLIGQDRKVLVINQDYRFSTKTQLTLTKAWGAADGYDSIEIRRFTSATDRLVDFADGSILRAYDLNISQVQTLHVAEEARDLTADTIGVNSDGQLDARGRRIVNLADAVEAGDAIPLRQIQEWNDSALKSAQAAKVSETNSKTSETNAKTSELVAKTSETNASDSESLAHKWSSNPEDVIVANTEYSSLHYSLKSAKSAQASASSAASASTSETNAKTSETNSKTSETNAAASAQTAQDEAAKLGNMNDLAEAISSVDTTTKAVAWKGAGKWVGVTSAVNGTSDPATGTTVYGGELVSSYTVSGALKGKVGLRVKWTGGQAKQAQITLDADSANTTWTLPSSSGTLANRADVFGPTDVTDVPWVNMSLQAGWSVISSQRAVYRKVMGVVYIDMHIAGGAYSDGTIVAGLPAAYRSACPLTVVPFAVASGSQIPPRVVIDLAGQIKLLNVGGNGELHLTFCYTVQ